LTDRPATAAPATFAPPAEAVRYRPGVQRLALFDLDETLVRRNRAFALWAGEFVAEHGLEPKWATWLVLADACHEGPMDRFFAAVRDELRLTASVEQLWRQYRGRMPRLVSCRAADLTALTRLRDHGWRIGIVTNGMTDTQLGKIRTTGLDRYVDGWCISEEVGVRKPDPQIFRAAARRCGVNPDDGGWMVGDNLTADIAGGAGAGLQTVWLTDPRSAGRPTDRGTDFPRLTVPHATVTSVTDAVDVLLDSGQRTPDLT
jgi:HAD superfamily hydrolase (TIGR01549 family)